MFEPGKKFGKYEIVRHIDSGGMADVYLGTDTVLNRKVAIKVLARQIASNPEAVRRFHREIRAAGSLDHPGIATIYDTGDVDGQVFFTMRLLDGGTLRDRMFQPMEWRSALKIASDIALALSHAHDAGLVHRDIKPENILFDDRGDPILTDFGIARLHAGGDTITQDGARIGTPLYMSPEQFKGGLVDARSDIYSLGCMLFEMLAGRSPYDGGQPLVLAHKHLSDPIPLLPPSLTSLQPLIDASMAKLPGSRPATAREFRTMVQERIPESSASALTVLNNATATTGHGGLGASTPKPEPVKRPRRRKPVESSYERELQQRRTISVQRFTREAESQFQLDYARLTVGWSRLALLFAFSFYAFFGFSDLLYFPVSQYSFWLIRFGIICPVFVITIAFTYHPTFNRFMQWSLLFASLIAIWGFQAMIALADPSEAIAPMYYVAGEMLFLMGAFSFLGVQFRFGLAVTTVFMVGHVSVLLILSRKFPPSDWLTGFIFSSFMLFPTCFLGVGIVFVLEALRRREFLLRLQTQADRDQSDDLLRNILPNKIATALKDGKESIAQAHESVSVVFADIENFTPLAARMEPEEMVGFLDHLFSIFDECVEKTGLEKIKTIGDCYMAAAGIPEPRPDHAIAAATFALMIRDASRGAPLPVALTIGVASGPVVAGVIGNKKFTYDLWGEVVSTASRMEGMAKGGEIHITQGTYDLISHRFNCKRLGSVSIKGKGEVEMYQLLSAKPVSSKSGRGLSPQDPP